MIKSTSIISVFFVVFLFSPYVLLMTRFPDLALPESAELIWALENSFIQAFLSASLTLILALLFVPGFSFLANRISSRVLDFLILMPTFLPALFTILVVMATLRPFPTGLIGVVFIHIFLNTGFATILVMQIIYRKLIPLLEVAAVEGARPWFFFRNIFGYIYRDLLGIFIFLFILCFANFSVPFVAGGGKGTTIEILIYEKIRVSGQWGQALFLALFQLLVLAIFSFFNPSFTNKASGRSHHVFLLPSRFSAAALVIFSGAPMTVFMLKSLSAWEQVFLVPGLWEIAMGTVSISLMFSLAVGCVTLALLMLTAYLDGDAWIHRLLLSVVSPSTALVGFSLLFFLPDHEPWNSLKWIFGFVYLVFTGLYRWGWRQALTDLERQIVVAQSLGASRWIIFSKIKMPQLIFPASQIAGIASLWAIGDFALGKIIFGEDVTLSLLIQTLMSSYRSDAALALLSLLMFLGALSYLFFLGVGYVGRRTSEQEI